MPDNQGYRHTLRICNTYYFFTAVMVTRTRLNVMFIRTCPVFFRVHPIRTGSEGHPSSSLRVSLQPSCSYYLSIFKDCRFVTAITRTSPHVHQFTQFSLISLPHNIPDVGPTKTPTVGFGVL